MKIITSLFIVITLLLLNITSVFASSHCGTLAGQSVTIGGGGINHKYTGITCGAAIRDPGSTGLAIGQTSTVRECIGTTGGRVWIRYCAANECEARYDAIVPDPPAQCSAPDTTLTGVGKAFGVIIPPIPIQKLGFGAAGISAFLSNLVVLIYSISVIIVLFMFFWASFDWITSGGEKEKLASAQKRIVNAVVGLVLLASSFAILKVLSIFTGFSFFK